MRKTGRTRASSRRNRWHMGWFENQIEERKRSDERVLEEALLAISDSITGKIRVGGTDVAAQTEGAVAAALGYYGEKLPEGAAVDKDAGMAETIDRWLAPTGVMARPVRLKRGWHKDAVGAFVGFTEDDVPVALLPRARGGYSYVSPETGSLEVVGPGSVKLKEEAYCFYRPLPARALRIRDLGIYTMRSLDRGDYVALLLSMAAATLLGMFTPLVNQVIFGPVVSSGDARLVLPVLSLFLGASVAELFFGAVRSLVMSRITTKLTLPLQAAVMMRVLSLPARFFRDQETGELATRIQAVSSIASTLQSAILSSSLTSVFSLVYVLQIATFAPSLVAPSLIVVACSTVLSIVVVIVQQARSKEMLELSGKLGAWEYSLISGIQKIKLSGAETRAFSKWAHDYSKVAWLTYNGPFVTRLSGTVSLAISLAGTLAIYASAISSGVSTADYMAFTSAFGMVSGAFSALTSTAAQFAGIKPNLERAAPILDAVPEASRGAEPVRRLGGSFSLDHVTFSYGDGERPVLDDLSLSVKRGSYVAIVGKTGCGKSTLMRLLLGFEEPQRGAVTYDNRDLRSLDVQGVRRNIGVVLQDGKLFSGSIFDNIAISCPDLTEEGAWKAAELAGLADDIRDMPMGMQTMIAEGGGGISGGQRQRLMIARAVAGHPRILMFDEATSALDNVTQRIVSESLDGLRCTRLVIAHRLSTIRRCERIVLIDQGKIAEDGTYDELIEKDGLFADLVRRQQV